MEHKNNVKINREIGLTSLVETFWTIGTSIAAAGVLQPHCQAHCQVAQPNAQPKPAKELAFPSHEEASTIKHETLTKAIRNAGKVLNINNIVINRVNSKLKINCFKIPHYA